MALSAEQLPKEMCTRGSRSMVSVKTVRNQNGTTMCEITMSM